MTLRGSSSVLVVLALLSGCSDPPAAPVPPPRFDAGRSEPVADPVYPQHGNPSIDVLHYGLELRWESRILTGTAELTMRAVRPLPEVSLDFSAALAVTRASVDGASVTPRRNADKLVLPLAEPVEQDADLRVTIEYTGAPKPTKMPSTRADAQDGAGLRATSDGGAWTMQEPFGAFTWYPCSDHPSDEALYDISLTAPPGWTGVASGSYQGVREGKAVFASTEPVATYLTTVAFGKYTETKLTGPRGTPISLWTQPSDAALLPALKQAPKHLEWLEERFGPYPMSSAGFVLVPSTSATETQEMVTMGSAIAAGFPSPQRLEQFESVMVHELAHHWFGNAVTPRDWRGIWLSEGWATYADGLWEVDQGRRSLAELVSGLRQLDARSRATAGPPGSYDKARFAEANVYVGPALMLHEIRTRIGDAAFFALGRDWVQTQRDSHQDRASFTAFVNRHTGRDLTAVIDAWLDSPTTPR